MALNITKAPNNLHAIFSDIDEFRFLDDTFPANLDRYYIVTIAIGAEANEFKIFPDINGIGSFKPRYVLSNYVNLDLKYNVNTFTTDNDAVVDYSFFVKSYTNSGALLNTSVTVNKHGIPSVQQAHDPFNMYDYIWSRDGSCEWLNNFPVNNKLDRYLEIEEDEYLSASLITGDVGYGIDPYYAGYAPTGLRFKAYLKSGGTNTVDKSYTIDMNSGLTTFNISPSLCGVSVSDIEYYTIQPLPVGSGQLLTVKVRNKDSRIDNRYRFNYLNEMGVSNQFSFNKKDREFISVEKETYINNNYNKIYKTNVQNNYNCISDYMNNNTSIYLKHLYSSPLVALLDGSTAINDVIINNKNTEIYREHRENLIAHEINFTFADNYNSIQI